MEAKDWMPPEPREIRYLCGPADLAPWKLFGDPEPQLDSRTREAKAGGERVPDTASSPKENLREESKEPFRLAAGEEDQDFAPDYPTAWAGRKRKAEALYGFSFEDECQPPRKRPRTEAAAYPPSSSGH